MPGTSGERDSATPTVGPRMGVTGALVVQASRLHVQPGRLHHKTTRMGLPFVAHASRVQDGKSEIRNPKSSRVPGIPNSEFRIADGLRPSRRTVASAWLMASSF